MAQPDLALLTMRVRQSTLSKMLGKADSPAPAGVYSVGANAVYWLEVIEHRPDGSVAARHIVEKAKRAVRSRGVVIEPAVLYPLVRGSDVRQWGSKSLSAILLVPDPTPQRGIDIAFFEDCPRTWEYFKGARKFLRHRAAFPEQSADAIWNGERMVNLRESADREAATRHRRPQDL